MNISFILALSIQGACDTKVPRKRRFVFRGGRLAWNLYQLTKLFIKVVSFILWKTNNY